jgi:hypothetical protein
MKGKGKRVKLLGVDWARGKDFTAKVYGYVSSGGTMVIERVEYSVERQPKNRTNQAGEERK